MLTVSIKTAVNRDGDGEVFRHPAVLPVVFTRAVALSATSAYLGAATHLQCPRIARLHIEVEGPSSSSALARSAQVLFHCPADLDLLNEKHLAGHPWC